MLIQLLHSIITLTLIFTTIYCCGLGMLKKINLKNDQDIFLTILVGYTFVGTIAVLFHFFFKIHNIFSFLLISLSVIFFLIFYFYFIIDTNESISLRIFGPPNRL